MKNILFLNCTEWTKRNVELKQIGQISKEDFPVFIKTVIPKIFIAGVFQKIADFKKVTNGLQDTEEILVASIVDNIQAEARSFVKDGVVKDVAFYEGSADLTSGRDFVQSLLTPTKANCPMFQLLTLHLVNKQAGSFLNLMLVGVQDLTAVVRKKLLTALLVRQSIVTSPSDPKQQLTWVWRYRG